MEKERVRVLVVDDDIQVGKIIECFVKEIFGGECKIAECAESGISTITEGFVPDVIISDFLMPGLDGIEFFRALKEVGFEGKWLFVTGTLDNRLRNFSFENNLEVLGKPFTMGDFTVALKNLMEE